MSGTKPWLNFYTSDWRAEITLKQVSREARSLWIDILCLIHDAGDGRLHFEGKNPTEKELAAALGDNPRTIRKLLRELENANVFSRDQEQFIVSRRIIRDLTKAERDTKNGRTGGNPSLLNKSLHEMGVNPPVKAQKPEARGQKPEEEREGVTADAGGYAFAGTTIRLNQGDLDRWTDAFPGLSLKSELWALDEWAGSQKLKGKSWFNAVAGALAKKQRAYNERVTAAAARRDQGGDAKPRSNRI